MTLADTSAVAIACGRKPGTIRSWASRGKLTRYHDPHNPRRVLYDLDAAATLASLIDNTATQVQHSEHSRRTV